MPVDWSKIQTTDQAAALIAGHPCVCGGMGYIKLPVELGHPLFGKAVPCPCKQEAIRRVRAIAMERQSGLSKAQIGRFTFASFRPGFVMVPEGSNEAEVRTAADVAKATCETWASHPQGWLVLSGVRGCGKTHLAVAVASAQLRASRPVYYNTVVGMLNQIRTTYEIGNHDEYVRGLREVDVLVIDDLGGERRNDWTDEQLFDVLDNRYVERRPVMITTNAAPGDMALSDRLASRLREGADVTGGFVQEVVLPAGDCRPKVAWGGRVGV